MDDNGVNDFERRHDKAPVKIKALFTRTTSPTGLLSPYGNAAMGCPYGFAPFRCPFFKIFLGDPAQVFFQGLFGHMNAPVTEDDQFLAIVIGSIIR